MLVQVDAISLTYTTLTTPTNRQLWYPNERIRATTFANVTNSGNAARSLTVALDVDTPARIPLALLDTAKEIVAQNPKEFEGEPGVSYGVSADPMKYVLTVFWTLSHPAADMARAARMQNAMNSAIFQKLAELGARSSAPPRRAPGVDHPDYFNPPSTNGSKKDEGSIQMPAEAVQERATVGLAAALEVPTAAAIREVRRRRITS